MSIKRSLRRKKKKPLPTTDLTTPSSLFQQALSLHQNGQLQQAEVLYKQIIAQQPEKHDALNLLGVLYLQLGNRDNALLNLTYAVSLAPKNPKYHFDLGVALQKLGNLEGAIEHYRTATHLLPSYLEAWENLGVCLTDTGQHQEAANAYQKSFSLNPHSLITLSNFAIVKRWLGKHHEALNLLASALTQDPVHIPTRDKCSQLLLSLGKFKTGWREYFWRIYSTGYFIPAKNFVPLPKWDGFSLINKRIVIHAEQGIGDEVMFLSCMNDLLSLRPAHVTVLCDPRLTHFIERSFPSVAVYPQKKLEWGDIGENIRADFRIPMGDLPNYFRTSQKDFKNNASYLVPDSTLTEYWSRRVQGLGKGFKIGISWRGSNDPRISAARSIPLHLWAPILEQDQCTFINLQYGDCTQDFNALPDKLQNRIACFDEIDPLLNLESFSALIKCLDLVITIDNSTVHFAGALGTHTWLLLPALADFRWTLAIPDNKCLWYSSVTLFRQEYGKYGQWKELLQQTAAELENYTKQSKPVPAPSLPKTDNRLESRIDRKAKEKVLLLNDTSFWYHWGCTCTSIAMRRELQDQGVCVKAIPINNLNQLPLLPADTDQLQDKSFFLQFCNTQPELIGSLQTADRIIINGEGSLHGSSRLTVALLYLAWIAKTRFQKPAHVINHSCYPDNSALKTGSPRETFYRTVYKVLDTIAVRESVSYRLLQSLDLHPVLSFDCLPLFIDKYKYLISDQKKNRILIAGSVAWSDQMMQAMCATISTLKEQSIEVAVIFGANAFPAADDSQFITRLYKLLPGKLRFIHATSEREWLEVIATSRLLISGRFHHSIAAACLKTPFVVLDSNTPKINGLMEDLKLTTQINNANRELSQSLIQLTHDMLRSPDSYLLAEEIHQSILKRSKQNFTF